MGSKYAGTTIFKLAAQRRRNAKEIDSPKFIRDENGKLLTNDEDILHRWKRYCNGLLNERFPIRYNPTAAPNYLDVDDATEEEVFDAVKNAKNNKAVGPDGIPAEFWKKMGQTGVTWLQTLIRKLLHGDQMPDQ